jgi:hypothetical protein
MPQYTTFPKSRLSAEVRNRRAYETNEGRVGVFAASVRMQSDERPFLFERNFTAQSFDALFPNANVRIRPLWQCKAMLLRKTDVGG